MTPHSHAALPQLAGRPVVTDGGLETDLIYHHGVDLPHFAAFPLVDDDRGRELLRGYYDDYVAIARRAGAALQLETPTWRASSDWGERLGYSAAELARVNRDAVRLLAEVRDDSGLDSLLVSGSLGPRGDGYVAGDVVDPDEAATYHAPQIEAFAEAGADLITVLTLTGTGEAIGIVRAARSAALPVAVSFTVEQDGRLPDGTSLAAAIAEVDAAGRPDYFMVNCAHPTHIAVGLDEPERGARGSSESAPTRRASATPSSTRRPSWTRATPSSWPPPRSGCARSCRTSLWSVGAAAPTPATSRRCGAWTRDEDRAADEIAPRSVSRLEQGQVCDAVSQATARSARSCCCKLLRRMTPRWLMFI